MRRIGSFIAIFCFFGILAFGPINANAQTVVIQTCYPECITTNTQTVAVQTCYPRYTTCPETVVIKCSPPQCILDKTCVYVKRADCCVEYCGLPDCDCCCGCCNVNVKFVTYPDP